MSDSDLTAFAALQELARLSAVAKEAQTNAPMLRNAANAYRNHAAGANLHRPKRALERAAAEIDAAATALEDFMLVVHEEGKILEERLTVVAVKQADLDEIHRRRREQVKKGPEKAKENMAHLLNSGVWVVSDGAGTTT